MCRALTAAVAVVAFVPAQTDAQAFISEGDLVRASEGRTVQVGSPATGRTQSLPLEVYVARVLAGEGEANAAMAARQALAVAIRTFAAANVARHADEGFELCDETHCQVLGESTPDSREAALATAGVVLLHDGVPAELFYSASCGGRTERAADVWGVDFPYLQSRIDDVHADDEPWTAEISLNEIQRGLRQAGFVGVRLRGVRVVARSVSGRVNRLAVDGMRPAVVSGDDFRLAVGPTVVRSTAFEVASGRDPVRFTGQGYGHGVGMCVIGAGRRAARGETYEEILEQYYPGLVLARHGALPMVPEATVAVSAPGPVVAHVAARGGIDAAELEAMAALAQARLGDLLGVSTGAAGGLTIELHESLDRFWLATGQPWWTGAVSRGAIIHLAPAAALTERGGLEMTVRVAVAALLLSGAVADRPVWIRAGAARHFARMSLGLPRVTVAGSANDCPADAELTLAVSPAALRSAEARAEACFVNALARTNGDWRQVR